MTITISNTGTTNATASAVGGSVTQHVMGQDAHGVKEEEKVGKEEEKPLFDGEVPFKIRFRVENTTASGFVRTTIVTPGGGDSTDKTLVLKVEDEEENEENDVTRKCFLLDAVNRDIVGSFIIDDNTLIKRTNRSIMVVISGGEYCTYWGTTIESRHRLQLKPVPHVGMDDGIVLGFLYSKVSGPMYEILVSSKEASPKTKELEETQKQLGFIKHDVKGLKEKSHRAIRKLYTKCIVEVVRRHSKSIAHQMSNDVGVVGVVRGFWNLAFKDDFDHTKVLQEYNKCKNKNGVKVVGQHAEKLDYAAQILKSYLLDQGYPVDP